MRFERIGVIGIEEDGAFVFWAPWLIVPPAPKIRHLAATEIWDQSRIIVVLLRFDARIAIAEPEV